jgi:hypothetical protein
VHPGDQLLAERVAPVVARGAGDDDEQRDQRGERLAGKDQTPVGAFDPQEPPGAPPEEGRLGSAYQALQPVPRPA